MKMHLALGLPNVPKLNGWALFSSCLAIGLAIHGGGICAALAHSGWYFVAVLSTCVLGSATVLSLSILMLRSDSDVDGQSLFAKIWDKLTAAAYFVCGLGLLVLPKLMIV